MSRIAGIVELKVNGELYKVAGAVTYSLGKPTREAIVGHDGVHGYKEMPTVPYLECDLTDYSEFSLDRLSEVTNATITVTLANGKVVVFRKAWCTNKDGLAVESENAKVSVRFEAMSAEEVAA